MAAATTPTEIIASIQVEGAPSSPATTMPPTEIKLIPPIVVEPVWPPTEEEKKLATDVAKFRSVNAAYIEENKDQQIVADCIANDRACIRFLLARGMDMGKASIMLKEATEYRKKMGTDAILDAPFPLAPKIKEKYHHCYHGYDKEGRPVYYELTGLLDIPFLQKAWTPEEFLHYHTHNTEYFRRVLLPAASVRAGRRIDQVTSIIDLNGLGRHHLTKAAYNFLSNVSKVDQLIYPEVLGRMVIINAGMIFSIAWAIIKPWLEERTRNKISIIRSDGKDELLKYIDADQLPRQLGGRCTCGTTNPNEPATGGCITASPFAQTWLTLAETGLTAQNRARAAIAAAATAAAAAAASTATTSPSTTPSSTTAAAATPVAASSTSDATPADTAASPTSPASSTSIAPTP